MLTKAVTPGGPIRRPAALAVLKSEPLMATVQVEMRSTAPEEVKNRDLEIIFGYESPSRFYYVHLAGITDPNHNGIFLVDNKDRRRIDDGTTPPQLKDREWHRVRLERDGASGRIDMFVDGSRRLFCARPISRSPPAASGSDHSTTPESFVRSRIGISEMIQRNLGVSWLRCGRCAFRSILVAAVVAIAAPAVFADVTRFEVRATRDVSGGRSFGSAGPYEEVTGRLYFAVDPDDRRIVW